MSERVLFLTGHLARPRLEKVLAELEGLPFDWTVRDIGVTVAALMTEAITEPVLKPIRNILPNLGGIDISPVVVILIIIFIQRVIIGNLYEAIV